MISDARIVVTIPNAEPPARNGIIRNYVSYESIKSSGEGNWVFKGAHVVSANANSSMGYPNGLQLE